MKRGRAGGEEMSRGLWVPTYTGRKFMLGESGRGDPDQICLTDISHSLSNICRYLGHLKRFYSVAEHSFRLSYLVPKRAEVVALMHDAHEAYVGDYPWPVKQLLPDYQALETVVAHRVLSGFGLWDKFMEHRDVVGEMDGWIRTCEESELHPAHEITPDNRSAPSLCPTILKSWQERDARFRTIAWWPWGWSADLAETCFISRAVALGIQCPIHDCPACSPPEQRPPTRSRA